MTEPDWDTVMEQRAEMERDPVPVMLKVAGKRFACERCGANVFSRAGENFACNGCGTLYGEGG